MAKRGAGTDLNQDNWDAEEESEEAGVYSSASQDVLQNRVIKKARRTLTEVDDGGKSSPFSCFGGFKKETKLTCNKAELPGEKHKQNGVGESSSIQLNTSTSGGEQKAKKFCPMETSNKTAKAGDGPYLQNLSKLNKQFVDWVNYYFDKNSYSNFSPVCKEYLEYEAKLYAMSPTKQAPHSFAMNVEKSTPFKIPSFPSTTSKPSSSLADSSADSIAKSGFSKFIKNQQSAEKSSTDSDDSEMSYGAGFKSNTTNTSTFSFGKATRTETSSGSPIGPAISFSSGNKNSKEDGDKEKDTEVDTSKTSTPMSNFNFPIKSSFGSSSIFQKKDDNVKEAFRFSVAPVDTATFRFGAPPAVISSSNENVEEEEYVPPKNDSTAVIEDDAFYTKRCKIFFKKGDAYLEKGIGILYLKPLNNKTQLLIRNDTNIGTVILNIILTASIPTAKNGKNNILLTCIPNPPVDPKNPDSKESVPILIRVKTSEDADELLNKLEEHKS